jgi:putative DNA primase/helicase
MSMPRKPKADRPSLAIANVEETLPPHNIEAEKGVLGSMLLDNSLIPEIFSILQPEDFFRDTHAILYQSILSLYKRTGRVDGLLLADELTLKGDIGKAGGDEAIVSVLQAPPSAANGIHYAWIVLERGLARKMLEDTSRTDQEIRSQALDVGQILALAQRRLSANTERFNSGKTERSLEELGVICLDDILEQEVHWLWDGRLPRGKITLLAGEGEIGKTYLTLDIISRLSVGRDWPDQLGNAPEPCDCVFVTAEDGLADTIKPRLRTMGADVKRVFTLGLARTPNGRSSVFTIADIDRLEAVMAKYPGIKLIVIDPISAFLGKVDENKNAELRGLLGPLSEFADKYGVAIIAITHFGKNPSSKATARILGSVAYSNAARVTWCVIPDPEEEGRCLMLRVKNNLSPNKTGMAYRIIDGKVEWEPTPIDLRPNDVLASEKPANTARKERVIEAIRKVLADGELPSEEAKARLAAMGFGKNVVWGHKDEAGVIARKTGFGKHGAWHWRLSEAFIPSKSNDSSMTTRDDIIDFDGWPTPFKAPEVQADFKPQ